MAISPFGARADEMVEVARCAEDSGFGGVWTYDHMTGAMLGRGRSHDAFALLGAMANATQRVRVGPLVANMMNRHPVQLAVAMATLQSLSSGRAVLGLGAGSAPGSLFAGEHEAIGLELLDGPGRRRRLVETVSVVRRLWAGESQFNGEFFTIDGPGIVIGDEPPPPIIFGASGRRTVELAIEHADGINITSTKQLPDLLALIERTRPGPEFETSVHLPVDLDHPDGGEPVATEATAVARRVLALNAPFDLPALERIGARLFND